MASSRIFHSTATSGAGLIGSGMHPWSKPGHWVGLINALNNLLLKKKSNVKHFYGEYNYVLPAEEVEKHTGIKPTLLYSDGSVIDLKDAVFRITRPDTGDYHNNDEDDDDDDDDKTKRSKKKRPCRYKRYSEVCVEMQHVLNASAAGFGVPCYAAFAFKSRYVGIASGREVDLFGSFYVYKRGEKDLSDLISARVRDVLLERNTRTAEQQELAMAKGVGKFVNRLILPSILKQAQQLALNFDCKPTNFIIFSNKEAFLTDFDTTLYSLNVNFASFETCFFVNLLLLCTHVRAWVDCRFADAFLKSVKELLLELCMHARSSTWLFEARIRATKFTPMRADKAEKAKEKLESVVHSYFVERVEEAKYATQPRLQLGKPLVSQILKFAVTGSPIGRDADVCRVLGEEV